MFSSEFSNWLLPCFSWPAITTRICGSVMRSRAAVSRSTRSPRSLVSAILRVWSMSSTMTRTCRGSLGCVTPDSLIDCIYRTHDPAGTIAVPAGPCVRRRSEPEVGFHPGVLVAGLVDRRVGVHRVVVRRAVVVHRVVVYGAVRQRRRVHRVVVHRVVGGCRRGVHDVGAVVHAVGVAAAVDARRGLVAVYRRRVAVGHRRRAVTGGLDDRAVVRGEHVAVGGDVALADPVVVADRDAGVRAGVDVAVVDGVAVAEDRPVTADDVAVVQPGDHDGAGALRGGLVAQRDVAHLEVDAVVVLDVGGRAQDAVAARQIRARRKGGLRGPRRRPGGRRVVGLKALKALEALEALEALAAVVVRHRPLQADDGVAVAQRHAGPENTGGLGSDTQKMSKPGCSAANPWSSPGWCSWTPGSVTPLATSSATCTSSAGMG